MKILFSGLNGLTGSHLASLLLSDRSKLSVASIVRSDISCDTSLSSSLLPSDFFVGDISDSDFLADVLDSYRPDVFVHLAQMSLAPSIVRSCILANHFPRLIILGTTGVFSKFPSCSHPYRLAERYLQAFYPKDRLLVLRSNLIYGTYRDKNFHKLFDRVKFSKPIPLPDNSETLYQPIFYSDLACIIYSALAGNESGFFNVCGPDVLSLSDVIAFFSRELSIAPRIIKLPLQRFVPIISLFESFPFFDALLPITSEQILRLRENKIYFNHTDVFCQGSSLTPFAVGLRSYFNAPYI